MNYELRLYRDEIAPGAIVSAMQESRGVAATYVVSGSLRVCTAASSAACSANSAFFLLEAAEIAGGNVPTLALRWTLHRPGDEPVSRTGQGVATSLLMSAPIELDEAKSYLLRCDRVDFPPRGVAFLHTHQGGGIRCLLSGSIEIETQGARHRHGPLQAWFEAGPDPVFAAASETEPSAFVRLMILPRSLLGKSSISYVNAEDLARPKSQSYQVFIDKPFEVPR